MIYAIPHNRDHIANHFMKAKQFAFLTEDNALISNAINPSSAIGSSCKDKKATLSLIKEMKADAVIVRNIGERALEKLLSQGLRVFKVNGQTPISMAVSSDMVELTEASQGRPSENHNKKGGCAGHVSCSGHSNDGGCCHHGHQHHHERGLGKGGKQRFSAISSLSPLSRN
jgi:predicted Fe-Mo cluster-binding NifX family protein